MSISKTLLAAILGVSLVSVTLMTLLAYSRSGAVLQSEIRENLRADATGLMQQIDTTLFERLQDLNGWRQLDIMQDTRVGDVDKRLANFLAETRSAYGDVYRQIFCIDLNGRIVAASSPDLIGRQWPRQQAWMTASLPSGEIELLRPDLLADGKDATLAMRAALTDAYSRTAMGELYALLNWREMQRLLDSAAGAAGQAQRYVALLDAGGRVIAASASLRAHGIMARADLASWRSDAAGSGTFTREDGDPVLGAVEVGYATSKGYQQLPGFGWQVLLMEPKAVAFAKIAHLLWALLALLAVTMLFGALMAIIVARRIASPIQHLTAYTRRFQSDKDAPASLSARGHGEIAELTRAFADMVSSLRASERQLVQAAKLAVVGEMAAVMAHEVRTPLGILRSSGQLLTREPALTPEGREMVGFVLSETDRLNRLITTLIDCARPRPPQFRSASTHRIIERAVDLVKTQAAARSVAIETRLRAARVDAWCDPEQILQVFLNLLLNAIQVLPAEGRILVSSGDQDRATVVEVQDDGPGIPAENRDRIFDPFVSYRQGGIGLGLTVVRQILSAHSVTISVGESAGGGALFRLIFPIPDAASEEDPWPPNES